MVEEDLQDVFEELFRESQIHVVSE